MFKPEIDRGSRGKCNICQKTGRLSWDHVPPKGSVAISSTEIRLLYGGAVGSREDYKISQNGLKFRTICPSCNSRLGRDFDPTLNEFTKDVLTFVRSELRLPPIVRIRTRPMSLARAVIGHTMAGKLTPDQSAFDRKLRDALLKPERELPRGVHVYCWVYPHPEAKVIRDIGMPSVRGRLSSDFAVYNILKYAPLAFMVTETDVYQGLFCLTPFRSLRNDEVAEVELNLSSTYKADWPENADDSNVVLMGQAGAEAVEGIRREP